MALSRSTDEGETWSPLVRVLGDGAGNFTYRIPTPVFAADGTLLLNAVNSSSPRWASLQLVSRDEGATWGAPAPLAASLGAWDGILGGPGAGVALRAGTPGAGRLVLCGATRYGGGAGGAHAGASNVLLSDDGGASWRAALAAGFALPSSECALTQLRNGSLLINCREEEALPCHCRTQARSDDGGETWSAPQPVPSLPEPVCSAGLLAPAAGADALFFSNPASETSRVNMTVRTSADGGGSWSGGTLVRAGPAAYSALVPLAGAGVAVVFETGAVTPYEEIAFATIVAPGRAKGAAGRWLV